MVKRIAVIIFMAFFFVQCKQDKSVKQRPTSEKLIPQKHEFSATNIHSLEILNGKGSISVLTDETLAAIHIVLDTPSNAPHGCVAEVTSENGKIKIGDDVFNRSICPANIKVSIPKGLTLNIRTHDGILKIQKHRGALNYFLGSGNLEANGDFSAITGQTGSADSKLSGQFNEVDLQSGSGNISIGYLQPASTGRLAIRQGSGNANITFLDKKTKFSLKFRSGSGELYNDLETFTVSELSINFRSGSGDLNIKSKK